MSALKLLRAARGYAVLVGAMDALTGLALVAAPAVTLGLMGASAPGAEAMEYVRFIGVFVAAVGVGYLWIAVARAPAAFRAGLWVTLVFRLGAGGYALTAVLRGVFDAGWLVVGATDLGCVAVQAWFLGKGVGRED